MRLRQLFAEARLYSRHRAAIEVRRYRPMAASLLDLEALGPVLGGKVPLVVSAHRASDIEAAIAFAAEERIRLVISGGAEAWRVASVLARAGVGVLVDPEVNQPETYDTLGARPDNAALLHRAGVRVGFSAAGAAHDARSLRFSVGRSVAWGLPHSAALEGLTSAPARLFGLEDRGTLRVGALANLVIWSGDPLELSTRVRHLVIHGREIPLVTRQTLLLQRYRGRAVGP
jgi:imidazolonepropionase-like amidohydrolase